MADVCRICYDDIDPEDEDVIVPCKCSGSCRFVHRNCLDIWRSQNPNSDNFRRCNQCMFEYIMENPNPRGDEQDRREQYRNAIKKDNYISLVWTIAVLIVIVVLLIIIDVKGYMKARWGFKSYIFLGIIIMLLMSHFLGPRENRMSMMTPLILGINPTSIVAVAVFGLCVTAFKNVTYYVAGRRSDYHQRIFLRTEAQIQRIKCFKNCPQDMPA